MNEHQPNQAVALTYDGKSAPFVSASGSLQLAEEIIRIARENEVPIYENPQLVDILARLEVGDEIPELLYRAIAEIIAFVYMLKGKAPEGFGQSPRHPGHRKDDPERLPSPSEQNNKP